MFIFYKGISFVPQRRHLNAYKDGILIAKCRISERMTLEDIIDVINELLEM